MKKQSKAKFVFNFLLFIGIIVMIRYLLDNSLGEIFAQLMKTRMVVIGYIVGLGFMYQLIEGNVIRDIACHFQKDFTVSDGFFTSCYSAFYRVITFGAGTLVSEVHFYRKKGLAVSQGIGLMTLHMVMYKLAVIALAVLGLISQFSLLQQYAPKVIPFIITGIVVTFLLVIVLLAVSSSIRLQVLLIVAANKWLKNAKAREFVDRCNRQIYSLRETVQTIMEDRLAAMRIFCWNVCKLLFWYVIPYIVLVQTHSDLDLLLIMSFTGFSVILSGVFPTPAGIGPFEFIYLLLFTPLVGSIDAVASLLLYRFSSFVLPFIIGLGYVLTEKINQVFLRKTEK